MSPVATGLFLVSAFALLGTPGPGIAALLAIGKLHGFRGSLRFLAGLLLGLATAAGVSASGLLSILSALPPLAGALSMAAIIYLLWLAWSVAMTPVGEAGKTAEVATTFAAGYLLGISNPKAYLAFVTLFASQTLVLSSHGGDAAAKWALTVGVIIIVDLAWLQVGASLGRVLLSPRAERYTNIALGLCILVVAAHSLSILSEPFMASGSTHSILQRL